MFDALLHYRKQMAVVCLSLRTHVTRILTIRIASHPNTLILHISIHKNKILNILLALAGERRSWSLVLSRRKVDLFQLPPHGL